jgi:hypothetical protein
MMRRESAKANWAIANETPCFSWFSSSFLGSHSNLTSAISAGYHEASKIAICLYGRIEGLPILPPVFFR